MPEEQVIGEAAMRRIESALQRKEHWLAYNTVPYFLEREDVFSFRLKEEARAFSQNNSGKFHHYDVIHAASLRDLLLRIPYGQQLNRSILPSLKTTTMNEKNYEYLADQLKFTGFGESLHQDLRKQMERQQPSFTLHHQTTYGKDNAEATLHFRKSDQSDMFFFNKYDLQVKKEDESPKLSQTFYVNKGNTVTLKEGYNLLDGRAVQKMLTNKEGERYQAWIQLNFSQKTTAGNYEIKQYHQNYGFDLEKTLSKYPIKELADEQSKEALIKSLQKGNLQSATFLRDNKEEKLFITPNVAYMTLRVYDANMQRVPIKSLSPTEDQKQDIREDKKIGQRQSTDTAMHQKDEDHASKKPRQRPKIG